MTGEVLRLRQDLDEAHVLIGAMVANLGLAQDGPLLPCCRQMAEEIRNAREELPRLRKEVAELRRLLIREEPV